MRRFAARWPHAWASVLAVVLLAGGVATPAAALETRPGDAAATGYTRESVRAATWNMCGEAGGSYASAAGYRPWRNGAVTGRYRPDGSAILDGTGPRRKMEGVVRLIDERNLNAVLLQEVCAGTTPGDSSGTSHLDELAKLLAGKGWSFASAGVTRPDDKYGVEPERKDPELVDSEGSDCRGDALTGTLSVAIAVKGRITWRSEDDFRTPVGTGLSMNSGTILCAEVADWESHLCSTHVSGFHADTTKKKDPDDPAQANWEVPISPATADAYYQKQLGTIVDTVKKFPSVVLGGDFNTSDQETPQPLYSLMAECDQRAYLPNDGTYDDAVNEATKLTRTDGATRPDGGYKSYAMTSSKIDYLFSTDGFTGCDARTDFGDSTDYLAEHQPECQSVAKNCKPDDDAYSDHTPLYGYTQGGPAVSWKLDGGAAATTGGSAGLTGASGDGTSDWRTGEHGGALYMDGRVDEAVAAGGPAFDTAHSFTASAWAELDADAGTSAVLSQDGNRVSGVILFYNAGDNSWRFGLPKADADGWNIDQAVAPGAVKGQWTRLTGVYDSATGKASLFVDGTKRAETTHTARWRANGTFVVGRDLVGGVRNAGFKGHVQRAEAFGHALRADQVASYSATMAPPTGKNIAMAGIEGTNSQGCHQHGDDYGNTFGTAVTLTPTLTATVRHPDPSKDVWAEFSLWDNTTSTQILSLGTPASKSTVVKGQGTVSLTAPRLTPGHSYGWRVRTADATTGNTPVSANCHFKAPEA
ncbi:LamG-like jellyroll fold domain-containing protein [Streptomyces sp. NPDC057242]|uniref:LamG-like jellyroll fold domain-containing protein n=1 Tax=unclassified Streptomyces TaxID=2593676 RepID=UPI003630260D